MGGEKSIVEKRGRDESSSFTFVAMPLVSISVIYCNLLSSVWTVSVKVNLHLPYGITMLPATRHRWTCPIL